MPFVPLRRLLVSPADPERRCLLVGTADDLQRQWQTGLGEPVGQRQRAQFEQVVAVATDDYVSQYELGIADERLSLWKEAQTHLEIACRLAPEAGQCRKELEGVRGKVSGQTRN